MERLPRDFFARDTLAVARDLLGRRLVRSLDGQRLAGRIVEVEAYVGEDDQASHAACGPTARNAAMYGPPGHAYVYLIYGVHHCLNVVTATAGFPAAVLVRAIEPLEGLQRMHALRGGRVPSATALASGPGRLCQALAIDRRFDRADLCAADALLFLEAGRAVEDAAVTAGPRVGVRGDAATRVRPWRFRLLDCPFVSHRGR